MCSFINDLFTVSSFFKLWIIVFQISSISLTDSEQYQEISNKFTAGCVVKFHWLL